MPSQVKAPTRTGDAQVKYADAVKNRMTVLCPKVGNCHWMSKFLSPTLMFVLAAIIFAFNTHQVSAGDGGKVTINERYSYESVRQTSRPLDAHASTLRSRLGFVSPKFKFVRFGAEFENIAEIGSDDYNNTLNGNITRPVVVDIRSTEVNQAYLELFVLPETRVLGGRYKKNIDNMRYIGSVDWRQNDQTFDGATVTTNIIPGTDVFYGYIGNVNRIFSDRSPVGNLSSNIHLLNSKFEKIIPGATLTTYSYLLDIFDIDRLSNASYGASLAGKLPIGDTLKFKYRIEYARQTDYADNPIDYSTDYYHIAPALAWNGLTTTFGLENLGSDQGIAAFQTPLATGHVFNGFADIFLSTPAGGLQDVYVDVTYKVSGITGPLNVLNGLILKAQYHDFQSDVGDIDYGTEIDFYAKLPLQRGFYVEAKYADYNANQFGVDTEKFIVGVGYKADIGFEKINQLVAARD